MPANKPQPIRHLALIPDGNRRWAKNHKKTVLDAYNHGFEGIKKFLQVAKNWDIPIVTVWGFSTENWHRPKSEISILMKLAQKLFDEYKTFFQQEKIKVVHIGNKSNLQDKQPEVFDRLLELEQSTANFTDRTLCLAFDYGGEDELLRAIAKLLEDGINPQKLNRQLLHSYLDTAKLQYPEPDIVIRTSGEMRLSGFMPLQAAYAELFFCHKKLPEIEEADIEAILEEFMGRERRFGGNS